MNRVGDFLTLSDGALFGRRIWCDRRGHYVDHGVERVADFFFHQMRKSPDGSVIHLRCKHSKTKRIRCPVKGRIKASGEIMSLRGSHNHLPEYNGHGLDVRTARGNWLRALRDNPQESPINAVLKERRRLPLEVAAQIHPVAHVPTARRQAAAGRTPQIRRPPKLHEVMNANRILGFTGEADGRPYLRISPPENDSDVTESGSTFDLLSEPAGEITDDENVDDTSGQGARYQTDEDDISHSWDLLNMGLITPMNFIDRVKFKIDGGTQRGEKIAVRPSVHITDQGIAKRVLQHDHDYEQTSAVYLGDHSYTHSPL